MIDTTLVRALAALLIANSHLEDFYPLRMLAADGLLGDSLFFLLSGLGLALSHERSPRGFWPWYGRRLARIMPSVFLVVQIFDAGLKGGWRSWTPADLAANLLWARAYPFIGQILVYYVFYYLILRFGGARILPVFLAALFPPLLAAPLLGSGAEALHAFHWVFYFQLMLLGGWLAQKRKWLAAGGARDLLAAAGLLAVYGGLRWASASGRLGGASILPYLLVMPLDVLILRACQAPALRATIRKWRPAEWLLATLAAATLEIYLAHYQFITSHTIASLAFPLNVVVFFAATFALAVAVHRAAGWMRLPLGRLAAAVGSGIGRGSITAPKASHSRIPSATAGVHRRT